MKLLNIMFMLDDFVNIIFGEVLDKRFDITIIRTHCVRIGDFGGIPEWSVRPYGPVERWPTPIGRGMCRQRL